VAHGGAQCHQTGADDRQDAHLIWVSAPWAMAMGCSARRTRLRLQGYYITCMTNDILHASYTPGLRCYPLDWVLARSGSCILTPPCPTPDVPRRSGAWQVCRFLCIPCSADALRFHFSRIAVLPWACHTTRATSVPPSLCSLRNTQ
jgi:hypothetical protein